VTGLSELPAAAPVYSPGGQGWTTNSGCGPANTTSTTWANTVGLITGRKRRKDQVTPEGLPAEIQLQDTRSCSLIQYKGKRMWRIAGKMYNLPDVYHERQYPCGAPRSAVSAGVRGCQHRRVPVAAAVLRTTGSAPVAYESVDEEHRQGLVTSSGTRRSVVPRHHPERRPDGDG